LNQSVLLGGLFIGVLSALPIVNLANCCCLWIIGGGVLSVYFAQQDHPYPLGLMEGARIGFRAGVAGAVIWLLSSLVIDSIVAPLQQSAADLLLRNASDIPPQVRAWLESAADSTTGSARVIAGFLFQLFIAAPFASLGGLLGAALFAPAEVSPQEP
jgi:hypothetical protein